MYKRNVFPKKYVTGKIFNNDEQIVKFFTVITERNISKIKEFIANNHININTQNENGETALHILCDNIPDDNDNTYNIIETLIQDGIAVNKQNKYNVTALHLAIENQNENIIKLLLDNKADITAIDNNGMSIFHYFISGKVITCEAKKKVKSIVPESNLSYSTKEINNLTRCIIDIYLDKNINYLIKHVDNTVAKLDIIFPQLFRERESKIIDTINSVLSDVAVNNFEKKTSIATVINQSMKSLYDEIISSKLKLSTKKINIRTGYIDGFYPEIGQTSDMVKYNVLGIMPYNNIFEFLDRTRKTTEITKYITDTCNKYVNGMQLVMNRFGEALHNIHDNVFQVIHLTNNVLINNNQIDQHGNQNNIIAQNIDYIRGRACMRSQWLNTLTAKFFIPYNNNKISTNDIGNNKDLDLGDLVLKYDDHINVNIYFNILVSTTFNMPNMYRAYKDQVDNAVKLRHNVEKYPITADLVPCVGTTVPNFARDYNISIIEYDKPQLSAFLQQANQYGEYIFFITKYVYGYNRIVEIYINLNNTVNTFKRDIKNGTISVDIIDIIVYTIDDILNAIKQLAYLSSSQDTLAIINDIERDLTLCLQTNQDHPYAFNFEHAIGNIAKIKQEFNVIIRTIPEIYENLLILQNSCQFYIKLINTTYAENYTNKYYSIKNGVIAADPKVEIELDLTYDQEIGGMKKLPSNLKEFIDANISDKKLVEQYAILFDKYNNPILYGNNISDDDIEAKIGYGTLFDLINIDPIIPGGDISNNIQRLLNANINKANANYKHGSFGIKNELYKFRLFDNAIPIIGDTLDNHFYALKFIIIQHIMILFVNSHANTLASTRFITDNTLMAKIDESRNKILNYINKISGTKVLNKTTLYIMAGKIADELFISYLDSALGNFCNNYIKKILFQINSNNIRNIIEDIYGKQKVLFFKKKFSFDYDQKKYIKQILNSSDKDDVSELLITLRFNQMLVLENIKQKEYYKIYSQNYDNVLDLPENCIEHNNDIFEHLLKHTKKVNIVDKNKMTPLFYAIQYLNVDLVNMLLKVNADFTIIKNNIGLTALEYTNKNLINHANHISNTLLNNSFYNLIQTNITNDILAKAEFKNNVPINLDLIFPTLLYMYNQIFYVSMINYDKYWNFGNTQDILLLLIKYKIIDDKAVSITDIPFAQFISTSSYIYADEVQPLEIYRTKIQNEQNKIQNLKNLNMNSQVQIGSEGNVIDTSGKYVKKRANDAILLRGKENDLNNQDIENKIQSHNVDNNIVTIINKNKDNFYNEIKTFKSYKNLGLPSSTYNELYSIFKRGNNGLFYNKLWKLYLEKNNNDTINIHVIINKLLKKIGSGDIKELDDVLKIYKILFVPIIQEYKDGEYYNKNIILTEVINIITHIISTNILNNMYYNIMKLLSKFIQDSNQAVHKDDNKFYNDLLAEFEAYDDFRLRAYIINEMPIILVKNILKIYEKHIDEHMNITIDDVFNKVVELLISNVVFNINQDSVIVKNLIEYIIPYYKYIIQQYVPKMKVVIDNYNRFIINESRNLEIIVELKKRI